MTRSISALLGATVVAGVVVGAVGYEVRSDGLYRNLRVVDPGVLYRSGQLDQAALGRVAREFNIQTVVSFRDVRADKEPDPELEAEERFCESRGISYVRLSPEPWGPDATGRIPVNENVREFIQVIDKRREAGAVLIHCMRGVHRTGAYTAIYRMEFNGWSNAEAIAEMVDRGYDTLEDDPDILQYLGGYTPRRPAPVSVGPRSGG
ncbi:MAG TPA: tyrosine-protein phosphatase [Fimbriiglobus sp.]|nr:tyrosine-protein phosphatase [Fimbriiglobus sp.]